VKTQRKKYQKIIPMKSKKGKAVKAAKEKNGRNT